MMLTCGGSVQLGRHRAVWYVEGLSTRLSIESRCTRARPRRPQVLADVLPCVCYCDHARVFDVVLYDRSGPWCSSGHASYAGAVEVARAEVARRGWILDKEIPNDGPESEASATVG